MAVEKVQLDSELEEVAAEGIVSFGQSLPPRRGET